MGTRNNPGTFNCYSAALPDEEIFTVLARDPAMPETIRFWVKERARLGKAETREDLDRILQAGSVAIAAETWRTKNLDPTGDGVPSWKLPRQFVDDEDPIRMLPTEESPYNAGQVIAKIVVGLRQITEGMMADQMDAMVNGEFADRINGFARELADLQIVDDRAVEYNGTAQDMPEWPVERKPGYAALASQAGMVASDDSLILRLSTAVERLKDGRKPVPYDLYRAVAVFQTDPGEGGGEGWSYECAGIGVDDLEQLLARLKAQAFPVVPDQIDSDTTDLAHKPEMPGHRFSSFTKGQRYAYARGLEIAPVHLPRALDAMAKDGWRLLAIFGQTDSEHIGFIFEREQPTVMTFGIDGADIDLDAVRQAVAAGTIRPIKPGTGLDGNSDCGIGRGQEP